MDKSEMDSHRKSPAPKFRVSLGVVLSCSAVLLQSCVTTTDVDSGVYVVEVIGGVPELVGEPGGAPVWSPGGNAIAWATEDGLYRRDLTSAQSSLLADNAVAGRPAWSPDGSAIAFVDQAEENLVVLEAQTGEVRFRAPAETEDADRRPLSLPVLGGPAWSPDGSRLAFTCWDGQGDEVCVIRADGTDYRQVTHIEVPKVSSASPSGTLVLAAANTGPPAWSPDSTALAVGVYPEQRGAAAGVFVVDLEGGTARRVSPALPNSEIMWFADGESLLFSASERGRSDALRTWVAGHETENLTAGLTSGAREPVLSDDGARLAVASGGAIVIIDVSGHVEGAIESQHYDRLPAWNPSGERIAFLATPDLLLSYS